MKIPFLVSLIEVICFVGKFKEFSLQEKTIGVKSVKLIFKAKSLQTETIPETKCN